MRPPITVGGVGGSGTRVVALVLERAGVHIGDNTNLELDTLDLVPFYHRWIEPYVLRRRHPLGRDEMADMAVDFAAAIAAQREFVQSGDAVWGWKFPPTIRFLSFLEDRLPGFCCVHVVRDGRDICYSKTQFEFLDHGRATLDGEEIRVPAGFGAMLEDEAIFRLLMRARHWSRINDAATEFGESEMADRYLRIRFEDLCQEPVATVRRILEFCDLEGDAEELATAISRPASIGRWTQRPETERFLLNHVLQDSL